jgi:predicted ATPase/DNA-binding winged helix-turn-helix (wHTH) protein
MSAAHRPVETQAISFGPFQLFPKERLLMKGDTPVHMGGRAMDILIVLAERPGEVISKRELVERVWVGVTVDEGSLRFHVSLLRKTLGEGDPETNYVKNVPGRGYCLISLASPAKVQAGAVKIEAANLGSTGNLPARLSQLVGRDETIAHIAQTLTRRRFVTVVGPGGIGKTTAAIAACHTLSDDFEGAIYFIDFSSVREGHLVASAVANAIGMTITSEDCLPALIEFLQNRYILLVLDGCEHVVEALATLTDMIVKQAPRVHILATSRESLRVDGEQIHRLLPLSCPPAGAQLTAAEVVAFPAVQLFVQRVADHIDVFKLTDAEAPIISEICHKLDGIALAIELAAGRVSAYGIEGIAALLDDRFRLLWRGPRTALPRHQTLRATLDWSYNLLSGLEQTLLRRLAIFVGTFTLEAATTIGAGDDLDKADVVEALAALVAKSLLSLEVDATAVRYRLLDTTRAYCLDKLRETGDLARVSGFHAAYFQKFLDRAAPDVATSAAKSSPAVGIENLGNVRTALEWSLSEQGDPVTGIKLAASSAGYLLENSLLVECRRWTDAAVTQLKPGMVDLRSEMELHACRAVSTMFTQGNNEQVGSSFNRSLEIAEQLGDVGSQLRLHRDFHIYLTRVGDFRGALAMAQKSVDVAGIDNGAAGLMAHWMVGVTHHLMGNQKLTHVHCESALTSRSQVRTGHGYDHRIIALLAFARGLWLEGYPEQAVDVANQTIHEAESLGHTMTLCITFVWISYVYLWVGDFAAAEDVIERLAWNTAEHSIKPYEAIGIVLKGALAIRRRDPEAGLRLIREGQDRLRVNQHQALDSAFAGVHAEGLAMVGRVDEALAMVEPALARIEQRGETFETPELFRIKGNILGIATSRDPKAAEACLLRSVECAREQGALSWQLRSATDLARLWNKADRRKQAVALLAPLYERFKEGFESADVAAARLLLAELRR